MILGAVLKWRKFCKKICCYTVLSSNHTKTWHVRESYLKIETWFDVFYNQPLFLVRDGTNFFFLNGRFFCEKRCSAAIETILLSLFIYFLLLFFSSLSLRSYDLRSNKNIFIRDMYFEWMNLLYYITQYFNTYGENNNAK